MGKRLAIKGHPTRSKEVVELLRMLGGTDSNDFKCGNPNRFYHVLNGHICWGYIGPDEIDEYHIFTLEEFLEKYPFEVGYGVLDIADGNPGTIGGMKWDEDVSDMKYHVFFDNGDMGWYTNDTIAFLKEDENLEETQSNQYFDNFRKEFCECCGSQRCSGQDDELEYCERFKNIMDNSGKPFVENHKMGPKSKLPSKYYEDKMEKTQSSHDKSIFIMEHSMWPIVKDGFLEYKIADGYEVDKIENGNIILKPIKSKYPTTYVECCKVLGISYRAQLSYTNPDVERGNIYLTKEKYLFDTFMKLRICRNAYWKIAGEEMGLDKPWEPKHDYDEEIFFIYCDRINGIDKGQGFPTENYVLTFPTEEIRNAFYENFKDLIEQCKELL